MRRRDILKTGALAGAAVMLPGAAALGAKGELGAHQRVIAGLGGYSKRVIPCVVGDEVHLLASVDNLEAFADAEARRKAFPYDRIRAEGNFLTFQHGGTKYRVENVLPHHFDRRAAAHRQKS